jgi:hypothetical protein
VEILKKQHRILGIQSIVTLAISVSIANPGLAANPMNSVQDGRIISGGTFANTADSKTTFINSAGGGLWLKSGTTIRGVEVNSAGGLTNNGGTFHFYAPHDVVRIDGKVNVSGLQNGQGVYTGNGGRVFVDAAYLYQNGTITSNGINGGLVQVNVAGATLRSNASIEAKGMGGNGGVIAINSSGPVVMVLGSVMDTSGRVSGTFDTNLISIEGGLLIKEGILRADGVDAAFGGSRGGTIRLVATGQSTVAPIQDAVTRAANGPNPILSSDEKKVLPAEAQDYIRFYEGTVGMYGAPGQTLTSASGTRGLADTHNDYSQNGTPRAGDGGTILVSAVNDIPIGSQIMANGATGTRNPNGTPIRGGNGGTISLVAGHNIVPSSTFSIQADGGRGGWSNVSKGADSGDGGLIALNAKSLFTSIDSRPTSISASGGLGGDGLQPGRGGNGGLVVFSTDSLSMSPGNVQVRANGGQGGNNSGWRYGGQAGTLVSPNPAYLRSLPNVFTQLGALNGQAYNKPIQDVTQTNELLTHSENLLLLTKNGGSTVIAPNLFQRMLQATIRSVEDPTGTLGKARTEVTNKNTGTSAFVYRNLMLGSTRDNLTLDLNHPSGLGQPGAPAHLILPSPLSNGEAFTTLNTLNIVNNGSVTTPQVAGPNNDSPPTLVDLWLIGRNSNNLGGGRISIAANGNVSNSNLLGTVGIASGGSINIASTNNYFGSGVLTNAGGMHGGSIIIKTLGNITQNAGNFFEGSDLSSNGSLMGGTIRLAPQNDFNYRRTDGGNISISANGSLQGGIIDIRAGHDSIMNFGDGPGAPPMVTLQKITADGTSSTQGRGGYISVHAANSNIHNVPIEANGGLQNGTVSFTTGN